MRSTRPEHKNPTPGSILRHDPCTICTDTTPIPVNRTDIYAGNLGAVLIYNCLTCGTECRTELNAETFGKLSSVYARIHLQVEELADPARSRPATREDRGMMEVSVGIVTHAHPSALGGWIAQYRAQHMS